MLQRIKGLVPRDSLYDVRVEEVLPREKDGGAFVKFSYALPKTPYEETVDLVKTLEQEKQVLKVLEKRSVSSRAPSRSAPTMRSCSPLLPCSAAGRVHRECQV